VRLNSLDISIIVGYLILMVAIGLVLRRKAAKSQEQYLLGGKSLPWYMLGLSDASEMFDISGTMWMVSLCFVYGLKSIWIPWLWPVFNQVFLMVFVSKWLRRSNVTTGAEWLATRFGTTGKGVTASHSIVLVFAVLSCLGFMTYGFVGLGKFLLIFVPYSHIEPFIPFAVPDVFVPHLYGLVFTLFAVFYSVLGGMHSIVLGDFIKYILMTAACIGVAWVAFHDPAIHQLTQRVPSGWDSPFFGLRLNLDWKPILSQASDQMSKDGYSFFSVWLGLVLFKGILASLAGPAPNYDMQKILSAKSPKEASKLSGFVSIVLLPVRYSLVIALTVLCILHFSELNLLDSTGKTDFELLLPAAINTLLPNGLLGLLLTGLLGAFMGTFSGTLNAAQAYLVNDVYKKYINPDAGNRNLLAANYLVGISVVAVSVLLSLYVKNLNTILQWIVNALYGGYIAANLLKWIWWRFNANGYFWGMISGILCALAMILLSEIGGLNTEISPYSWPVILVVSLAGSIIGTYAAPATDREVLIAFYKNVRPYGFWGPIAREANIAPDKEKNGQRDILNLVLGILVQLLLTLLPMYLVLQHHLEVGILVGVLALLFWILKKTWWDKLTD
jgi:Na+/proline symporter